MDGLAARHGKYGRLAAFLRQCGAPEATMSFGEIETLLGFALPPSARRHRAFWSNNPDNNVMTRAWRDAGFRAARVDIEGESLVFVRDEPKREATDVQEPPKPFRGPDAGTTTKGRHPVIGCMKGTVTFLPGVDLTEPADPDWGRFAYGEEE